MAELRHSLGWSDIARERNQFYLQQYRSIALGQVLPDVTSNNFGPLRFNVAQAIEFYNQQPWHRIAAEPALEARFGNTLATQLAASGISLNTFGPGPNEASAAAARFANGTAESWRRLVAMSSSAAPLGGVIHDYYRSLGLPEADRPVSYDELQFNLQRGQFRRKEDRDRVLTPFAHWDAKEVLRFHAAGLIDAPTRDAMLRAAGVHQHQDRELTEAGQSLPDISVALALWLRGEVDEAQLRKWMALGGLTRRDMQDQVMKMAIKMPSMETLSQWANVHIWNDDFARRYELDDGYDESPLALFFAGVQGWKAQPALPNQPAGETDWFRLMFRSKNEMPTFVQCLEMQRRLRPDPNNPARAVVGNVPPWTLQNTLDVMKMKGFAPFFTRSIEAALVYEPLNLRFINHLLLPFMEHDDFRARWEPVIGPPEKWVAAAMLDHGYRPEICDAAAAGLIQQGTDHAFLERKNHEVDLRQKRRTQALAEYDLGRIDRATAVMRCTDKFVTEPMAEQYVTMADNKIGDDITKRKLAEIKKAWFGGKINAEFMAAQLTEIGIVPARKAQYIEEWTWERNEETRMLSTEQILAAMKNGLITPNVALMRLQNLGWNQADALVRIAQTERDVALAQARTQTATAMHAAALAAKAHAEQVREQKAAHAAAEKVEKAHAKMSRQTALASHEKLLAQSKYYAGVHASNARFQAADSSGNEEKKMAEIEKQVAAYQKYLIDQLKLVYEGPEVAARVLPIEVRPAAGPVQDEGDSPPDTTTPSSGREP